MAQRPVFNITVLELVAIDKANIIVMIARPPIDTQADLQASEGKVWHIAFSTLAETALIARLLWLGELLHCWKASRAVSRGFRRASDATWFACCRYRAEQHVSRIAYKGVPD